MSTAPDHIPAFRVAVEGDSAATLVAYTACRALMRFAEPEMPLTLSTDPARRPDQLSLLGIYSRMYALRAEEAARAGCHKADTNGPHLLMTATSTSVDLGRTLLAFARTSNDDPRAAEPAVHELLTILLAWRLLTGSTADELRKLVLASAAHTAGVLTGGVPGKLGAAIHNMAIAAADLDPDQPREDHAAIAAELARDARELGLAMREHGDPVEARKWLVLAAADQAATPAPQAADDDTSTPDSEVGAVDFGVDTARWRTLADRANKMARFLPADPHVPTTDPDSDDAVPLPCVEIAGVQVYSYLDGRDGRLRVSLHLDTAVPWLLVDDDRVPMRITVGGDDVFIAD